MEDQIKYLTSLINIPVSDYKVTKAVDQLLKRLCYLACQKAKVDVEPLIKLYEVSARWENTVKLYLKDPKYWKGFESDRPKLKKWKDLEVKQLGAPPKNIMFDPELLEAAQKKGMFVSDMKDNCKRLLEHADTDV